MLGLNRRFLRSCAVGLSLVTLLIGARVAYAGLYDFRYETTVRNAGVHWGGAFYMTPESFGQATCSHNHVYWGKKESEGLNARGALSVAMAAMLGGRKVEVAFAQPNGPGTQCFLRMINLR